MTQIVKMFEFYQLKPKQTPLCIYNNFLGSNPFITGKIESAYKCTWNIINVKSPLVSSNHNGYDCCPKSWNCIGR